MPLLDKQRSPVELSPKIDEARYFCLTGGRSVDDFLYMGGVERCELNYELKRDSFPFLTFEMVLQGQGSITLGDRERVLKAGDCFCFGPSLKHRIRSSGSIPLEKFFIVFGRNALPERGHPKDLYPGCAYEGARPEELRKWCGLILDEGVSQLADAVENVASLIEILVRKISRLAEEPLAITGTDALVAKSLRKIEGSFQSIRSVQELAEMLGVTPEHLCRAFRKSKHASPYRVLMRYKMAHAYTLLKRSALSVQEVADRVGFSDAFHFSRAFKKHYGKPPSHAR